MADKQKLSKEDLKKATGGIIVINNEFCPHCHMNLFLERGRIFCPVCGWTK